METVKLENFTQAFTPEERARVAARAKELAGEELKLIAKGEVLVSCASDGVTDAGKP